MTNEKMEQRLAAAVEKTAPNDANGVLSRCEERKGTVIPMTTKKTTKRRWTSLIAACLAVMLLGGGLFYQRANAVASVVSLDVNPSIELKVSRNEKVLACVPLNEDGTFSSMNCLGTWHAGRDYLDFCDRIARRAWRVGDRDALDWMWYLWIGFNSPASGRLVRTFERAYIADKSTWVEPMDPYFTLTKSPSVCDDIMREFGVAPMACSPTGHIINGHTPVKTTKGEQPIRAEGKLLVIDGGFCRAYHPKTGIAGYTLISSSRGCRLKSHRAFTTVAEALTRNVDIESETNRFDQADRRRMVSDTDTGAKIRSQIQDLRQLLDAYRNGAIEERA